jgi:hypothetical protein
VLFNICDAYIRRNEGQERVIGTLLGSVGHDGSVVIKNCYAVPHNESQGQVCAPASVFACPRRQGDTPQLSRRNQTRLQGAPCFLRSTQR